MARLRKAPAAGPDLRMLLAEHYRARDARRPGPLPTGRDDGSFFVLPWRRQAEWLEAGEAVDVYGWELRRWRPDLDGQARYRLEVDGSVTRIPYPRSARRPTDPPNEPPPTAA